MSKASESIRKIQEAARQRVLERVGKSKPAVSDKLVWIKAAELNKGVKSQIHAALAEDFFALKQTVVTQLSVDSVVPDIAPNNCRFILENSNARHDAHRHYNAGIMILEFPPTTRIMNADRRTFNIPFPYFYFIIHFSKATSKDGTVAFSIGGRGVGARTSPLKSLNDKIGCIPIPHTNGVHYICQSEANAGRSYESLQDLATDVVNTFWRTEFVHDFVPFVVDKKGVKSWSDWEKLTALDMLKVVLKGQTAVQTLIEPFVSSQNNPLRGKIQNLVAKAERALQTKIMMDVDFTKDIAKAMKEIVAQDSE